MTQHDELLKDPKTALVRLPYVNGKINSVRIIGEPLAGAGKKLDDTKEFSDEFLEFMKAATRMVNYLSGAFDAIDEVFGKGYAKGVFNRVIDAHQGAKADRRLKRQVDVLRRYLNDPKRNASKAAREAGVPVKYIGRWKKSKRIADLARLYSTLGTDTFNDYSGISVKEILGHLKEPSGKP